MTYAQFKSLVEATMIRNSTLLATGDAIKTAVNSAKLSAQLIHDFEYCRDTVTFSVNLTTGAALSSAVSTSDGVTARNVKRVEAAALSGGQPLWMVDQVGYRRMLRRQAGRTVDENDPPPTAPYVAYLVTQNNKIFLRGSSLSGTAVTVRADVVYYLADFSADNDTDFFLDKGLDWMLMAVAQRLNFFLKDDERIPVNLALMDRRWSELMTWDGSLVVPSDQYHAD